jgi:hypothetical protein
VQRILADMGSMEHRAPASTGTSQDHTGPGPRWFYRPWLIATGRKAEVDRLQRQIARMNQRLIWRREVLIKHVLDRRESGELDALARAEASLSLAQDAAGQWNAGQGWALFSEAQEFETLCLSEREIDAVRRCLESELSQDGSAGWWRDSALTQLRLLTAARAEPGAPQPEAPQPGTRQPGAHHLGAHHPGAQEPAATCPSLAALSGPSAALTRDPPREPTAGPSKQPPRETPAKRRATLAMHRALLRAALHERNESLNNRYYAREHTAKQRIWLSLILVVLLAVAGWLVVMHLDDVNVSLKTPWVLGAAAVAGVIGAVTSAMQRLRTDPKAQSPSRLGSFSTVMIQALIGSVAALTTYFTFASGLIQVPAGDTVMVLILAAFGSGFAERLVVYQPRADR